MKSQLGRLALVSVLACAMLGTWRTADADDVCRCWQEDLKDISPEFAAAIKEMQRAISEIHRQRGWLPEALEISTCSTRCECRGLPNVGFAGSQGDGSTVCIDGWCIRGKGSISEDGTVSLADAAELSVREKTIAVGSDKCD